MAQMLLLALLEQHAYEERAGSTSDWTFVVVSIALLLIVAAVPFLLLGGIFSLLSGFFR